jgi:hypothetical protein
MDGTWDLIPYVNLGLVNGTARSGVVSKVSDEKKSVYELGILHSELIKNVPPACLHSSHHLFMNRNVSELKSFKAPWFLPNFLCGLGLTPVVSGNSLHDRRTAAVLLKMYNLNTAVVKFVAEPEWVTHKFVLDTIRDEFPLVDSKSPFRDYEDSDTYPTAYLALVFWGGFSGGIQYKELRNAGEKALKRFIDSAVRTWQVASSKVGDSHRALSEQECLYEKKMSVFPITRSRLCANS